MVSLTVIHWIVIYPVDSAIQLLNNWGQASNSRMYTKKGPRCNKLSVTTAKFFQSLKWHFVILGFHCNIIIIIIIIIYCYYHGQYYWYFFICLHVVFRDTLDIPSYPQSFDIAVSPDLSLRNSKSQGKGDPRRRER